MNGHCPGDLVTTNSHGRGNRSQAALDDRAVECHSRDAEARVGSLSYTRLVSPRRGRDRGTRKCAR